jgi:FtsP/CotA-like multicopper oxidase with cupredoxin domain
MNRLMRRRHLVMRQHSKNRTVPLLVTGVAVAAIAALTGSAGAAPITINLCAVPSSINLPGEATNPVPTWVFEQDTGTVGSCADEPANPGLAGFTIDVPESSDPVTINVASTLPAGHPISLEIPGTNLRPTGTTNQWQFTPSAAGTYLYKSSGNAGRQQAMGLYGAVIVRPAAAGQAYDSATTAYDGEQALVLGQIDPLFNANPDTFDLNSSGRYQEGFRATYWLINGQPYTGTNSITAPAGAGRLLLRFVNAGYDNTSMTLLGLHDTVYGRDAHLLNDPLAANNETIPASGTEDAIVTVPTASASAPPVTAGYPLFNRELHVTNGAQLAADGGGGMMTFIKPQP